MHHVTVWLVAFGAIVIGVGFAFADRSWGRTYVLAVVGAVMVTAATVLMVRVRLTKRMTRARSR